MRYSLLLIVLLSGLVHAQPLRKTEVVWEKSFDFPEDARVWLQEGEGESFYLIVDKHECSDLGDSPAANFQKGETGAGVYRFDGRGELEWQHCFDSNRFHHLISVLNSSNGKLSLLFSTPPKPNKLLEQRPELQNASLAWVDLAANNGEMSLRWQLKDKKLLAAKGAASLSDSRLWVQSPVGFNAFTASGEARETLSMTGDNYLLQPVFCAHPQDTVYSVFGFSKDDRSRNVDGKTWSRQHERIWLAKYSPTGELLSSRPVLSRGAAKELSEVRQLPDSSYLICGQFADSIEVGGKNIKARTPWDIFICRLSPEGKVIWFNAYPMPTDVLKVKHAGFGISMLLFNPRTVDGTFFRVLKVDPEGKPKTVVMLDEREMEVLDFTTLKGEMALIAREKGKFTLLRVEY